VGDSSVNYVFNQVVWIRSLFAESPIGFVDPRGWLRKQLELVADEFTAVLLR